MALRSCLIFAVALTAAPAPAAEPAAVEGDAYEQLGVALELAARCESMRGFEYLYLAEAWAGQEAGSQAKSHANAAHKEASDSSGGNLLKTQFAAHAALKHHADAWRTKAEALGCEGGHNYLIQGAVESYKRLGGLMAIAVAFRNPDAKSPSPLPPLKDYEIDAVQAFNRTAVAFFGEQRAQFDAMLPQLAQERMARYPAYNSEATASAIIGDHRRAFAIIHHEILANNGKWTTRGATIADGSPFGYRTLRLSKDGAPTLTLIAAPAEVDILGGPKPVRAYLAVGVRDDGIVIAGLGGGNLHDAPDTVTVKAEDPGNPAKRVAIGQPTTDGCPYFRCFTFPHHATAPLATGTGRAYFYAARDAAGESFSVTRLDGTDVNPTLLKR